MENGTVIADRYRLDRRIGSGAMGSVWRAFDERLDRDVAVKVLHPGLQPDQQPVERFDREAKTLAGLTGPGFVGVHDFGVEEHDGEQIWFIAMELVETGSLSALLEERDHLSADETLRLVAETAEALDRAHRRGVVHRDIKPGNLLIDEEGHVRIVDFGISLLTERTRLTRDSAVLGTPAYIAPEQFGDDELTGAADLYSLGAVAYECLSGAPPFVGSRKESVIRGHLYDDPPPLAGDVPEAVSAIVTRCLRKEPADRWESAAELAAACRAAIGRPPDAGAVLPAPVPAATVEAERGGPERRRRRLALLIGVLAVLLVGAATAAIPWMRDSFERASTDRETTAAASATSTSSPSASGDPSSEAEESATDDEAEDPESSGGSGATANAGGDEESGGGGSGDSGGGDSGGGEPDPTQGGGGGGTEIPNLYGVQVAEAAADLEALGFTNVESQSVPGNGHNEGLEICDVKEQSPGAGTRASSGDKITLTYYAFAEHLCW